MSSYLLLKVCRGRVVILLLLFSLIPFRLPAEQEVPLPIIEEASPQPTEAIYQPEPLDRIITGGEIFGGRSGYFHPFFSLGGRYTDNLFNTPDDEEDEFITVLSPGLWVSFPASRQQLVRVRTLNTAPGGLAVSRFRVEADRRLQAYGLYRAEFREHANFSEEETESHHAEGFLQYNFRGGLSIELLDIYEKDQDAYSTGISRELDEFQSNLFNLLVAYQVTPKLLLRGDYSMYGLDYDAERNEFRDRDDNMVSFTILHRFLPKTSALLEYEFIDIDYDRNILADSEQHHFWGGVQWESGARARARIKLGYGLKDYDEEISDRDDLIGEIQIDYRFTPKSAVYLRALRRLDETDIRGAESLLSHRFQVGYNQRLGARLTGSADFSYVRDSYQDSITVDSRTGERQDDYYSLGASLGYAFRRWLNLSAGYTYVNRNSNFEEFDYQNNTLFLALTAAI